MSITKNANKIKFTYEYQDIADVVQLTTNEIAVTMLNNEGMPLLDEYGVTDDEKLTVVQKMKDGADEIFSKFLKVTNGVADSINLSASEVSCEINDRNAYNENTLKSIDRLIQSTIINYVIKEWFTDKKVADHAEIYGVKYIRGVREILKRSVQLRKPSLA